MSPVQDPHQGLSGRGANTGRKQRETVEQGAHPDRPFHKQSARSVGTTEKKAQSAR